MNNDVSKKRKKTSKEKRILIASLCIAAAVTAGSTFAWFTSRDEVTNRLSANAAYNVSVIETFTPPSNWIPGQKVNKDTSAINTGNIEAFVKQKLEGVMQVTLEYSDTSIPLSDTTKTYVELSEDEVDIIEAGGFLAWAPGSVPKGPISAVHSKVNIEKGAIGSDVQFAPPVNGLYVFRRAIDVNATNNNDLSTVTEEYEYVGYYYKDGAYYKVKNLNGLQPQDDGVLNVEPTAYYAIEKQEKKTLPLRYEEADIKYFFSFIKENEFDKTKLQCEAMVGASQDDTTFEAFKVNGSFYYVVKNSTTLTPGDVYTATDGTGRVGRVSNINEQTSYYEPKSTPDRLVATYTVGKSDDVFLDTNPDNRNDLGDGTAERYDQLRTAIANSDYLNAKFDYENAKNQYDINKKAYDAGVALLTALAENEKKLSDQNSAITAAGTTLGAKTISKLEFTDAAAVGDLFKTGAQDVNDDFGGFSGTNITSVNTLISKINTYLSAPTEDNWNAVQTAYDAVYEAFKAGNDELIDLEEAIADKWTIAPLDSNLTSKQKLTEISSYTAATASPQATATKAAAIQLINWEKRLAEYQEAVNTYFTSVKTIRNDSKYQLKDLRSLKKAYEDAAKATAPMWQKITSEGRTLRLEKSGEYSVDSQYKISVNDVGQSVIPLNTGNGKPRENAISENGYAGTAAITGATGNTQFTINGTPIPIESTDPKPVAPTEYDSNLKPTYEDALDAYNKYKTTQTNQESNKDIVIYINLKNVAKAETTAENEKKNKWEFTPTLVPGDTEANFYYTSILGSGETTEILVDSVELSGDTKNIAFKDFDFDLNVTVDSSQVVISEDGNSYETDAVIANDSFIAKPTKAKYDKPNVKPIRDNTLVYWN